MRDPVRSAAVLTHRRPAEVRDALRALREVAGRVGVELLIEADEAAKHGLAETPGVTVCPDEASLRRADLAIALGGDGTILRALRAFAGTGVATFALNFGQIGFLATVSADDCAAGFERAFAGEYDLLRLPAIAVDGPGVATAAAINDVSLHRRAGERVAVLSYSLGGEEVGSVRSDGIVVSTPAGSTGYNLANGGPVLAWGVEGYVVSFIAPHSLTARALVAAPDDRISIRNRSAGDVDVSVDGRPAGALAPGESLACRFEADAALLAQVPGTTFYRRLREKFGALAS